MAGRDRSTPSGCRGARGGSGRSRLDEDKAYELHPEVTLRPEPFGALVYHYRNRRLTFVRSQQLVALLESLGRHPTLRCALDAEMVGKEKRLSYLRALESLEASEVIRAC